jgi:Family of unknown function (DUF5947)
VSDPLAVLQRIRTNRPRGSPQAAEACELCTEPIPPDHGHVVDLQGRHLLCACRACHLLFTSGGAGGGHFRAIPDRYRAFPGFELLAEQWDSLQIPVSVAFFFVNTALERVAAFYPGPAGATESLLPLERWEELTASNPALCDMQPDVEAFLVRIQPDRSGSECYVVPIDACYELVGRLRQLWRGFDGGREARDAIDGFFTQIQARAR